MSGSQKEALRGWLPAIVAVIGFLGNAVWIGHWSGSIEQRLVAVEQHSTDHRQDAKNFVTKDEFSVQRTNRDREMADLRNLINTIDGKLDRLIEHELSNGRLTKNE